jgi:hypothetical protein
MKGLGHDIVREAVIVVAGAALAAFIVSKFPQFKAWIKESWQ